MIVDERRLLGSLALGHQYTTAGAKKQTLD